MEPNKFEVFYGNMPKFGLGAAMEHMQQQVIVKTARKRLETIKMPSQPYKITSLRKTINHYHFFVCHGYLP